MFYTSRHFNSGYGMQGDSCRPSTGKLSKGCAARRRREESSQLKAGSEASSPHVPSHLQPNIMMLYTIWSVCINWDCFWTCCCTNLWGTVVLVYTAWALYVVSLLHMFLIQSLFVIVNIVITVCYCACHARSLVLASHQLVLRLDLQLLMLVVAKRCRNCCHTELFRNTRYHRDKPEISQPTIAQQKT